jgi:hypothetical protein
MSFSSPVGIKRVKGRKYPAEQKLVPTELLATRHSPHIIKRAGHSLAMLGTNFSICFSVHVG